MMRSIGLVGIMALMSQTFSPAQAVVVPTPSSVDPRVQIVDFTPEQVILLKATLGYAVTIKFDDSERIETVSIGDSTNWQLTPNKRANVLFVKPMGAGSTTNMTVLTNLRHYQFELLPRRSAGPKDKNIIFSLLFTFPAPVLAVSDGGAVQQADEPPKELNNHYSYKGVNRGLPLKVFDDGVSTYFKFSEHTDYPAIFAIDINNKEEAVNSANRDGYVVIDRLASAFVMRRGRDTTMIINENYDTSDQLKTELKPYKKHSRNK